MRKITIGFSRNSKDAIFSVLLQKYLNRPYSHCYVKFETKKHLGEDSIYHSSMSSGVGFMSEPVFHENNETVAEYVLYLDDEKYTQVRNNLFKVCGKKYGFWQNIGIALVDIARELGCKINNPFVKNENCSELLYRHFISLAYPQFEYDHETITPKEREDIIKQIGEENER